MTKAAVAFALLAVGVAWAGDPAKDAVEIKPTVKVGDVFRFRQTEISGTEVGGKPKTSSESAQEYVVTVKTVRPDGGLDVEVSFERMQNKLLKHNGETLETDTGKPLAAGADMQTRMLDVMSRAFIGHAFTVTLDSHGTPTAVTGLGEAFKAGLKGSPFESVIHVDQIFTDEYAMKNVATLFVGAPAGAHSVGDRWTAQEKAEVGGRPLEFAVDATLAAATEGDATVESKYAWKPGAEATVGGAKAEGGGEVTTKFSRKDGLVLAMKRHLEADRETSAIKTTSHTDATIVRVTPELVRVMGYLKAAKVETTKTTMRAINDGLKLYYLKHNKLPASLMALCGPEGDDERILDCVNPPKDAWGNEFVYVPKDKRTFEFISYGADGVPGGEKDDADIKFSGLNKAADDGSGK